MTSVHRTNLATIAPPVGRYALLNTVASTHATTFVSGLFGIDPGGELAGSDTRSQTTQLFENVAGVLKGLDATASDLVYLNTYLTPHASVEEFLEVRTAVFDEWFPGGQYPGSTVLIVHALVSPVYLVEIDAIVAVPIA